MAGESDRRVGHAVSFGKAISHPLRVEILGRFTGESTQRSPSELAAMLGESLNLVSYHVRLLEKHGALKVVRTEPRRGALEHFYSLTKKGWRFRSALDRLLQEA
jgi:DNA-binding transcriptional ArsR family regulator